MTSRLKALDSDDRLTHSCGAISSLERFGERGLRVYRLSRGDLPAILDCLQTINATLDLEAFPRQVVASLRRVVSAPFGSYNEINHRAAQISYVVEPAEARVPHLELIVRQYLHEQPVVAHYRRTGDGSPRKLSDFLTQKEFHRLTIYNE